MNDDGMATPRNLAAREQPGSGALPEGKRSMDGVVSSVPTTGEGKEMLEHVQSATQSQQFKTVDDSKTQLHEDAQDVGLKKNLQTSQSDKVEQQQPASAGQGSPPPEEPQPVDHTKIQLANENSEAAMDVTN